MSASPSPARIAAFFDLDGTLLPLPSLERRLISALRCQGAIPLRNYLRWLGQAVRLSPQGLTRMAHANKMYLRNISTGHRALALGGAGTVDSERRRAGQEVAPAPGPPDHGAPAGARASSHPLSAFFWDGVHRVAWHAVQGHSILLVTGAPEPLAQGAALALTLRLLVRGITASVGVCATRLEQSHGRWTGRVVGQAISGEAKAGVLQRVAATRGFDLARCYAYGDTANDRWMLGAVGRPAAVNPSRELQRIARLRDWPIFHWEENLGDGASAAASTAHDRSAGGGEIPNIKSETWV